MEFLIDCMDDYALAATELYFLVAGFLYGYWLKPFVIRKRAAYAAAFFFWALPLAGRYVEKDGFGKLTAVLSFLIPFAIVYILDKRRNPAQKIFLCCIYMVIRWLPFEMLAEIGYYERDLVEKIPGFTDSITAILVEFFLWNTLLYGLSIILLYGGIRLLHRTYRRKQEELAWKELAMLLAPTSSFLVVRFIMLSYYNLWMKGIETGVFNANLPGDPYRILFCVFTYFSVFVIIVLYQDLKESRDEIYAGELLQKQISETHHHIGQIDALYEKMRAMRHDLGNHMAVIEGLAKTDHREELFAYIDQWKGNLKESELSVKTGNAVADVILSDYHQRFENSGVIFESAFRYPEDLSVDPFDMAVVLSNALQNALEASALTDDPKVWIQSIFEENIFLISIRNRTLSLPPEIKNNGLPTTSKKEEGHGYGLRNIRQVARKYRGEIRIDGEEDEKGPVFVLYVMFTTFPTHFT